MREIARLVLLNIRRHRLRALISAAGIGFGVAAMLTIVSVILGAIGMFQNILSTESTLVIFERNVSDLFFSSVPMDQIRELRTLPGVESIAPMLVGIVQSPDHPIITCFGIEADDPRLASAQWLSGDRSTFDQEPQRVVLGARAAEFMKASLGSKVTIGKGDFEVGGVIRTKNGFEDGGVFMPMNLAQDYFHRPDLASLATVKLMNSSDSASFRAEVTRRFPSLVALEDKEFNRSYSQFRILEVTAWAIGVCSFLLGGMGVANTMLMSVFSRVREIAILRVCGFSKKQIAALVFGEAAVLATFGVIVGFAMGVAGLEAMNAAPQLQGYVEAVIRPDILAAIAVVALITAAGGALYPAWFASKIQPAEALRFE